MFPNQQPIYLPIRSLGDFMISASVIKDNFRQKIPLILPEYLKSFFYSTCSDNYFDVLGHIDYYDQPAFYELYKVKNLFNLKRLIKDIKKIYLLTNNKNTYLLDYSSKRLGFVKAQLIWPDVNDNIYYGKKKMFCKYFKKNDKLQTDELILNSEPYRKILVLPGSRIRSKRIDTKLSLEIIKTFKNNQIQIAEFGNISSEPNDIIYYDDFAKLINLINSYDLIISAESLPYHLAYYLNKAHFVIYNQSKHFKQTFMTPFMVSNIYYSI